MPRRQLFLELRVVLSVGARRTRSGGKFPFGGGRKAANAAKWEEALKGKGGFPLRVITRDAKGRDSFKMEATKIEPGSVPDSMFSPPAGYQKFEMPDIGSMFKRG